jgi:hypothetical protein
MAVAARCPDVTGMQMTLVFDGQQGRREAGLQAPAQLLFSGTHASGLLR